eukprot:TRINITY_DN26369_c1_g1_i1.p1 TRINITY_DN26369_c1_g1~~TRINITY_DN26369_c1_g1_i1.p1  ORF type:complete len:265 (+),score=63.31 TRINITY_DN26369_c1_g1_i1:66-860(+)
MRGSRAVQAAAGADAAASSWHAVEGRWNFAYGANVNRHKLEQVRRIKPLESAPAVLRGHRLAFNHAGGMGNVLRAGPTANCHGVLHRLRPADFDKLADMECDYEMRCVPVEAYDGRIIHAEVFVSPPDKCCRDGLPPPDRYVRLIATGAAEWGLDVEHVRWLQSMPTCNSSQRGREYYTNPDGAKIVQTWRQKRQQQQQQQQPDRRPPGDGPSGGVEERRYDTDGKSYSKSEFRSFYGGYREWDAAAPASGGGDSRTAQRRRTQ